MYFFLLFFYYDSINPIPYGERSSRPHFGFLFVLFFSVRSTTFNFLEFCFYALRRVLANIQGYGVFRSKFIPNWMKKVPRKAKKPEFVKKWNRQKGAYKVANFFSSKVSYHLNLKVWSIKPIAFVVLERSLEGHIYILSLPYTGRINSYFI